jgi:cytochrome c oxidase subunit 2
VGRLRAPRRTVNRPDGTSFRGRRMLAVAASGVGVLTLSGCATGGRGFMNIPPSATREGGQIYNLWQGTWIAAMTVGILVWGLILWAVIVYRKRSDVLPEQVKYNMPIEILYTVAPLIIIMGLFFFTARDESALTKLTANPAQTVQVVGFRWEWTFNYVGPQAYDVGTPDQITTLWLPVNERVRFQLVSPDVIHSFWVPDFLFKMDVVPGRTNQFEMTPDKIGTFAGKCTEYCGTDHSRMLFNVKVVSQADFDAHMAALRAAGQSGQLTTGRTTNHGQKV